jgi:lipoyl(octanoyl) transferase
MSDRRLLVAALGTMPYAEALELQRAVARARISGAIPDDILLLVEHPPVITTGRTTKGQHLLASPELLKARGVELFDVERGGDVTFHGPGQLVGYPIIDLKQHRKDLHWYLRQVEEALIRALGQLGIGGERNEGFTGVWTRGPVGSALHPSRKIASIGVHARDWVTWHGFALNVTTDLSFFGLMVPCGIAGVDMTSITQETGGTIVTVDDVAPLVSSAFAEVFDLVAQQPISLADVQRQLGAGSVALPA